MWLISDQAFSELNKGGLLSAALLCSGGRHSVLVVIVLTEVFFSSSPERDKARTLSLCLACRGNERLNILSVESFKCDFLGELINDQLPSFFVYNEK